MCRQASQHASGKGILITVKTFTVLLCDSVAHLGICFTLSVCGFAVGLESLKALEANAEQLFAADQRRPTRDPRRLQLGAQPVRSNSSQARQFQSLKRKERDSAHAANPENEDKDEDKHELSIQEMQDVCTQALQCNRSERRGFLALHAPLWSSLA